MSHPQLKLVWVNEDLLTAAKNKGGAARGDTEITKSRLFGWAATKLGVPKWGQLGIVILLLAFAPLYARVFWYWPDLGGLKANI